MRRDSLEAVLLHGGWLATIRTSSHRLPWPQQVLALVGKSRALRKGAVPHEKFLCCR